MIIHYLMQNYLCTKYIFYNFYGIDFNVFLFFFCESVAKILLQIHRKTVLLYPFQTALQIRDIKNLSQQIIQKHKFLTH